MSLIKVEKLGAIEYLADRQHAIQVRKDTQIEDDGAPFGEPTYFRCVIMPGELSRCPDDFIRTNPDVVAICGTMHTPERISEYESFVQSQLNEQELSEHTSEE